MGWLAELGWQIGRWIVSETVLLVLFELIVKLISAIGRGCLRGLKRLCALARWTRTLSRLVLAATMAAGAGMPTEGAGQRPQETTAPFEGLSVIDGVVTSNDDYGIWLTWRSEHFRIRYPDGRPAFEQRADGVTSAHRARLNFPVSRGRPRRRD